MGSVQRCRASPPNKWFVPSARKHRQTASFRWRLIRCQRHEHAEALSSVTSTSCNRTSTSRLVTCSFSCKPFPLRSSPWSQKHLNHNSQRTSLSLSSNRPLAAPSQQTVPSSTPSSPTPPHLADGWELMSCTPSDVPIKVQWPLPSEEHLEGQTLICRRLFAPPSKPVLFSFGPFGYK